jgi:hypothetical protein
MGELSPKRLKNHLWFALHGYGQFGKILRKFNGIVDDRDFHHRLPQGFPDFIWT